MRKKKLKKFNPGPITIMLIISVILMFLSFLFNKLGVKGTLTDSDTLETTIVTVNNIFSKDGIRDVIGSSLRNFRAIEPLVAIIVSLITISILEVSGLLQHLFGGLKNVKSNIITFIVLFTSIISTLIGDYSYAILFPLVIALYKCINRDPKVGVMTTFIGITMGYGTGIIYNYQDIVLGRLTKTAAQNVIDSYTFNAPSMLFIMIASTILLAAVGTIMIEKEFSKKVRRQKEEELVTSKIALRTSMVACFIMVLIVIWSIIPNLPLSGWMLDDSSNSYMERLLGDNAPFKDGFILIVLSISLVCSYIYGKISRNIKDSSEFNRAISRTFQNTGFIFAGLFFASIMLSILNWTNLSTVISLNIIELLNASEMSGVFIVSLALFVSIVITILNPSTIANWTMASPVLVCNLARANISPEFTQMIFKAGDSIGKCFSPFYIFFIIMLGFLYKADSEEGNISFFGTMKKMMPVMLVMTITWFIIIIGWNLIGLPLGIGSSTTM